METDGTIPKSEIKEVKGLNKHLYKLVRWLGLGSGIGFIAWGAWWFLWSFLEYIFLSPQSVEQQIVQESRFTQVQLSAILVALGVLIMAVKKLGRQEQKPGNRRDS